MSVNITSIETLINQGAKLIGTGKNNGIQVYKTLLKDGGYKLNSFTKDGQPFKEVVKNHADRHGNFTTFVTDFLKNEEISCYRYNIKASKYNIPFDGVSYLKINSKLIDGDKYHKATSITVGKQSFIDKLLKRKKPIEVSFSRTQEYKEPKFVGYNMDLIEQFANKEFARYTLRRNANDSIYKELDNWSGLLSQKDFDFAKNIFDKLKISSKG